MNRLATLRDLIGGAHASRVLFATPPPQTSFTGTTKCIRQGAEYCTRGRVRSPEEP